MDETQSQAPLAAARPLTPRTALVTGASSGIGRATALLLASRGYRVGLLARRRERLEQAAAEVRSGGGQALVLVADVSDRDAVEHSVRTVADQWGRLDILVNNAGYGVWGSVEECLPEDFEQEMRVNYLGAVYATKAALPLMRAQGSGVIVNVSSISGYATSPYDASYCATKFALGAFTSTLRIELAGSGISVSMVCPGYTATEWSKAVVARRPYVVRTPVRPMTAESVAAQIVACIAHPRRRLMVPRALLAWVWLYAAAPAIHEWYQARFRR